MRISDWSSDVCSSDLFSISNAGAAASGLSVYDAGSGVRDVTLMVSGRFAVTQRIGVGAMAGVSRLLGDAADSPVEIGRASCRERVCQSVEISVVAVHINKTQIQSIQNA